jgi:hypothetical protein
MRTTGSLEFFFFWEKPEQRGSFDSEYFQKTEMGGSSISIFF